MGLSLRAGVRTGLLLLSACTGTLSVPPGFQSSPPLVNIPADAREITFPDDMTEWGWLVATQNGAALGCPDALPGQADAASVAQTTRAIQCRLDQLGLQGHPGSLFFPSGTYYIDRTLSLTQYQVVVAPDGSRSLIAQGGGNRSDWTNEVHLSGQDPASTKIVWAGDCGKDPNLADPAHTTKYNDILYVDGISPLIIERLTLDGQNCAGDGIDMVSKPGNMTGVTITEMVIQNLKEVGIVGDRPNLTQDEVFEGDTTGMVSEVTISNTAFAHVGYACVMPDAANAVDWWIRDSSFNDCAIGITNGHYGAGWAGTAPTPGLPWGSAGTGGFQVANCYFQQSRSVDIAGGNSVRNSYSIAAHGPFLEAYGNYLVQGNIVVASKGVIPVASWGGTSGVNVAQLMLLGNTFLTADNDPAVLVWTKTWGLTYPLNAFVGASPAAGNLWDVTYSNVASIGNRFSSTQPFSTASQALLTQNPGSTLDDFPGWAAAAQLFQCGPLGTSSDAAASGASALASARTKCQFSGPDNSPVYNLLTLDDVLGSRTQPVAPPLAAGPFVRPQVRRNHVLPRLSPANTPAAALANTVVLQNALNQLALNQTKCQDTDYACPDRWGILFIPPGTYYVSGTLEVPGGVQLQIVGAGETHLAWLPYGGSVSGPSPLFKLHAPAHVAIRDLALFGEPDIHDPNPTGEGIVAEVTDLSSSRVYSDGLRVWEGFDSTGIGNAAFEMRSFANGSTASGSTITGNGDPNAPGYFAYFAGNPSTLNVGGGAHLMVQDTWYEGGDSNLVSCADGDSADITVESSSLTLGGWHGVHADARTSFNIGGCTTKTTVLSSGVGRQGWAGLAPTQSFLLPGTATAQTQLLLLGNSTLNSNYGNSEDVVPSDYSAALDQGYLSVDPASQARYADLLGSFFQGIQDAASATDGAQLASTESGAMDADFIRSLLAQALDPRQAAPSRTVTAIGDPESTDIRIEHVWVAGTRLDLQFVLPGAPAQ